MPRWFINEIVYIFFCNFKLFFFIFIIMIMIYLFLFILLFFYLFFFFQILGDGRKYMVKNKFSLYIFFLLV